MGKKYKTDMSKIQKKLEEIGSGTFWKAQQDRNVIRILPPWNEEGLFYFEATLHYGLRKEGRARAFPCLGRSKCPVCQAAKELEEGTGEDKKLAKRFQPRTKYYANILDRKTVKVSIWGFSQKTLSILLSAMNDPDYGDITDPEEGFDIIVERSGTGLDTKYQIRVRPKPSEIGDIDWKELLLDLEEEVIEDISKSDLEEVVEENMGDAPPKKKRHEDDDDNDDDDDDKGKSKPKKAAGDDIEVGSQVSFEDDEGEEVTGEVIKVDEEEEEARVKDGDGHKHTIALEDLTLEEEKKKKKKDEDNDDDEDDQKERRKRRKERKEKREKKKKRGRR